MTEQQIDITEDLDPYLPQPADEIPVEEPDDGDTVPDEEDDAVVP